jgi:hypothetical protein
VATRFAVLVDSLAVDRVERAVVSPPFEERAVQSPAFERSVRSPRDGAPLTFFDFFLDGVQFLEATSSSWLLSWISSSSWSTLDSPSQRGGRAMFPSKVMGESLRDGRFSKGNTPITTRLTQRESIKMDFDENH